MKSKYLLLIIGLTVLTGCNKLTCDFKYTPDTPCIGAAVTFTNLSTGADDYEWDFGDNATSTNASPNHIYKKAGTYCVNLRVIRDKVQKKSCSKFITIIDSIPNFVKDVDTVRYFTPVKYTARIYNPWQARLSYRWELDPSAVVIAGKSLDSSAVICYYTNLDVHPRTTLTVYMDTTTVVVSHTDTVRDKAATAILMKRGYQTYRQRRYGLLLEAPHETEYPECKPLLAQAQDTIAVYNDSTFRLSTLVMPGHKVEGFQIDKFARKIYFRANGLYVANLDGSAIRQIDSAPVSALCVDVAYNRVYWSTAEGVKQLPLVVAPDNRYASTPQPINTLDNIDKLTIDPIER